MAYNSSLPSPPPPPPPLPLPLLQCHSIHRTIVDQFKYALVWVRNRALCFSGPDYVIIFGCPGNQYKVQPTEGGYATCDE